MLSEVEDARFVVLWLCSVPQIMEICWCPTK